MFGSYFEKVCFDLTTPQCPCFVPHHYLGDPEDELPTIDDPRVIDVRTKIDYVTREPYVLVEIKPWQDDDYTEVMNYDDYLDIVEKEKQGIKIWSE